MNEQQFWNELPQVIKVLTDSRANEFKNNSEGLEKWHAKHSRNGVWASTLFNDCDTKKRSTRKNHYDKELKTISFDTLPSSYKNACYFYKEKYDAFDFQLFASLAIPGFDVQSHEETRLGLGWHTDLDPIVISGLYGKSNYKLFHPQCDLITLKNKETLYFDKDVMHKGFSDINPRIVLSMATNKIINESNVTYFYENYFKPYVEKAD